MFAFARKIAELLFLSNVYKTADSEAGSPKPEESCMKSLSVITCAFALSVSMMALSPSTAQTPAGHKPDAQEASAQLAFDRLKTLAGHWKGRAMGPGLDAAVTVTLRVTSGGAAVMHEMVPEGRSEDPTNGDDDPITMLYLDSGRLTLTHYCDSGKNRPRMVGSLSADGKTLQFTLLDISGGRGIFARP